MTATDGCENASKWLFRGAYDSEEVAMYVDMIDKFMELKFLEKSKLSKIFYYLLIFPDKFKSANDLIAHFTDDDYE